MADDVVIAVHGGAGRRTMSAEPGDPDVHRSLAAALAAGHAVLTGGGRALDAVEAAVRALEDDPLFNAGRGAVLNREGGVELDASIMDGATSAGGGVGAIRRVRHPVSLARVLLDDRGHTLLAGPGAEALADERELERVAEEWLVTDVQQDRWRAWRARSMGTPALELGTVGAVARDARGDLAAATSTGGLRGKARGRIGDAAILGAGTWADGACAVSMTGDGDGILRAAAAHELAMLVRHGRALEDAAAEVLGARLADAAVDAGLVALDAHGAAVLRSNCGFMPRGVQRGDEAPRTALHD